MTALEEESDWEAVYDRLKEAQIAGDKRPDEEILEEILEMPVPRAGHRFVELALRLEPRVAKDQNGTPHWTDMRALVQDRCPSEHQELFMDLIYAAASERRQVQSEQMKDRMEDG